MGRNKDLTEFERGMIVGARLCGASLAQTARKVLKSRTTVCRVFKDWRTAQKRSTDRSRCGRKRLVSEEARRWLARLVESECERPSLTISSITDSLNAAQAQDKAVSARTVRRELRRLNFHTSRVSLVPYRRQSDGEPSDTGRETREETEGEEEDVAGMEEGKP
uniref:Transposase Tc1-like domain-containing protein n=1 Tax=Lepisosteus oculatus TaxID=7918 RepID=W5MIY1_LEPOC